MDDVTREGEEPVQRRRPLEVELLGNAYHLELRQDDEEKIQPVLGRRVLGS